jgi:predicted lipoprotein with Yx(FWY)xxD motif
VNNSSDIEVHMRPKHVSFSFAALAATALVAAACSSAAPTPSASVAGATATPAASSSAITIGSMTTSLGSFLTGPNGMTLYVFSADKPDQSNCSGQCATLWPPLTVTSGASVTPPSGATASFGTITRSDGTVQVTYNHMPLYYFANDSKAGDTNGQGVAGKWFVAPLSGMLPNAAPAGGAAAPSTAPSTGTGPTSNY